MLGAVLIPEKESIANLGIQIFVSPFVKVLRYSVAAGSIDVSHCIVLCQGTYCIISPVLCKV